MHISNKPITKCVPIIHAQNYASIIHTSPVVTQTQNPFHACVVLLGLLIHLFPNLFTGYYCSI